jgi:putative ABC transport system substrate-binding protein
MRRREFITLLGGAAAAWPMAVRAQQPRMPVIGLLNAVLFEGRMVAAVGAIRQGLKQTGFVEGQNVAIEYRTAESHYDRLAGLAADLVRRRVAVIVAIGGTTSVQAARAATPTIPIVFAVGTDPVESGLVSNLRRPEANLTGTTFNLAALAAKRLEIARELVPGAKSIGYLRNPTSVFDPVPANLTAAADALGLRLSVFDASTVDEIQTAFRSMAQQKTEALIPSADAVFSVGAPNQEIVTLAAQYAIPTIYAGRSAVETGGLISYGTDSSAQYRFAGLYAGRILKGDKPGDLPVMLPTKFELVLNLKTAKELGIEVPLPLLIRIDETIE